MKFLSITAELTALDAECAARHFRRLADLIDRDPGATNWFTSDIEGSVVADRNPDEAEETASR